MKSITLFEHEAQPFEWTTRDLSALERLNGAAGAEILHATTRHGKRVLQATQHVGVVRLGCRVVQVLPKIYYSSAASGESIAAREATANLLHMLAYARQLDVREQRLAPLLERDADWFEILTFLFSTHLMDEWQRGPYRGYQVCDEILPVLKGTWRLYVDACHPERRHTFTVSYDDFTVDNALNRVFRFTVDLLWRLTGDIGNRQRLDALRQWMTDVTLPSSLSPDAASPALLTRLNRRFEPLLNLARLFLQHTTLQLAGGGVTAFSFVFDMNHLFESFLSQIIMQHRATILPGDLQPCQVLPQSRGFTRYLARRATKQVFHLKPDLVFRSPHSDEVPLLVDTKYKALNQADRRLGVAEADFYQMHTYAHRYRCASVLLLYPQTIGMSEPVRACFPLQESDKRITVATVDLRRDLSRRRQDLVAELRGIFGTAGEA